MDSAFAAAQRQLLAKHGPVAEREAVKYNFTPAQKKIFVEVVAGYLSSHAGQAPPNGYDQIAALAKRNAK